jgi:hypothetical protein
MLIVDLIHPPLSANGKLGEMPDLDGDLVVLGIDCTA